MSDQDSTAQSMSRSIDRALADAWRTIDQHDRSGKSILRELTAEAWDELGDRCISDAVNPRTNDERYKESVTLAGLCYAKARAARNKDGT